MNKQRRKEIQSFSVSLEMIHKKLNKILEDEQDYYDNIPENLQIINYYQSSVKSQCKMHLKKLYN